MKNRIIFILLFILNLSTEVLGQEPEFVTVQELINDLEEIAQAMESSKIVQDEFVQLQQSHDVSADKKTYRDFVKVRLAFEATRDSGLWQIRWAVTNNEPSSDAIWAQWQKQISPQFENEKNVIATATAECDELSALFSFVAHKLGVKNVGLFWPTWNHTVAVWTPVGKDSKPVRIVVPTSQIFISESATLGTKEFDPNKQKNIYPYSRQDVALSYKIPEPLADMMITQLRKFIDKPSEFLQVRRNRLSKILNGS